MNRVDLSAEDLTDALVAASRRQPSSLLRNSDDAFLHDAKPKCWQVFFLPTEDIENHTLVTAFCPFTGIVAAGRSIDEAASNWTRRAYRILHVSEKNINFSIPKSMLQRRKIQYGEVTGTNNTSVPVYVLEYTGVDLSVIASPATREYSIYDPSLYEEGDATDSAERVASIVPFDLEFDESQVKLNESVDSSIMPGFLLDWVVCATPLTGISAESWPAPSPSSLGPAHIASEREKLMPLL